MHAHTRARTYTYIHTRTHTHVRGRPPAVLALSLPKDAFARVTAVLNLSARSNVFPTLACRKAASSLSHTVSRFRVVSRFLWHCVECVVCCVLFVCCFVTCCLLFVVCCLLLFACCLLFFVFLTHSTPIAVQRLECGGSTRLVQGGV
jgi:hypothetical protein